MEVIPYLGHSVRRWQIGSSTFLAWPEAGARLMHWSLTRGDGSVREVIHWPELQQIDAIAKVRGGNPILFPFSARTFDQGLIQHWRDPDGQRRPMPMHGFARQGRFRLAAINDAGFDAVLEPDDEARAAYPFDYEFRVCYRFSALSLACEFMLTNHGRTPLPWCAGHHFYFSVPWTDGHTRADYLLRLNAGKTARQDENGQLIDGPAFASPVSLGESKLADTFHYRLREPGCVFGPKDRSEQVTVKLGTSPTPPPDATLVTWIGDEQAPYYCVEPWMGPANAPEHKIGLHWVPPGQTQRFCVEVLVR